MSPPACSLPWGPCALLLALSEDGELALLGDDELLCELDDDDELELDDELDDEEELDELDDELLGGGWLLDDGEEGEDGVGIDGVCGVVGLLALGQPESMTQTRAAPKIRTPPLGPIIKPAGVANVG